MKGINEIMDEVGKLEEERDQLRKELRAYQEMLYQVLTEVGDPVIVSKETMMRGIQNDTRLAVVENGDNFVFSVEEVNVSQ